MIFEGISTGQCIITFGFSTNNAAPVALSRPFYLNLQEVTSLYEHWTVGDNTTTEWMNIPNRAVRTADSAVFNGPATVNDQDYILFVHGWRMQPWERRAFASTAYKRLWQLGYKGRFGLYSWPTDWVDDPLWQKLLDPRNYNRSERRAWDSALGLWDLLANKLPKMDGQPPERVRLIAHSMGNIVASEALRYRGQKANKPPMVQSYIASQAASVAHAYDATGPENVSWIYATPEIYATFPRNGTNQPYFTGMDNSVSRTGQGISRTFNFHNMSDYALNKWIYNQELEKPDTGAYSFPPYVPSVAVYPDGWDYSSSTKTYSRFIWGAGLVEEPAGYLVPQYNADEILAYVAQARSRALGAAVTPGYTVGGEIGNAVDLSATPFNFTGNQNDHSAEFNSINMNRRIYWQQVLSSFGLTNSFTPQ